MRRLMLTLAALAAAATPALAHHDRTIPTKLRTIERLYPDLHAREVARTPTSWARLRRMAESRWRRQHPAAEREHGLRALYAADTPAESRALGRLMAARRGWTGREWIALDALWGGRESGWARVWNTAGSGACHIPQALPCSKIPGGISASSRTAIRWGLDYIAGRYGRPSAALAHSYARGWY